MGTLAEDEPNTVGRAELMACVVAAESTRGNVVYVTYCEILKKRQDRGCPTPRLGQGSNRDLWWRMSQALKSRQGTFTVQWQRAHVAAADIKRENHDMVLDFGNEMMRWLSRRRAKRRCEERQQSRYPGWMRWLGRSKSGSLRQTCRFLKNHPNCLGFSRKGSQEGTVQNSSAISFRKDYTSIGISAIKAKV